MIGSTYKMDSRPDCEGGSKGLLVAVFRHTVFKPSEQFIPLQALSMPSSRVLVTSRDAIQNPVTGLETVSISDLGRRAVIRHTTLLDSRPLVETLSDRNVDILHAHFGVEGMYSIRAAKQLGIPHVTTLHGYDVTTSRRALVQSKKPAWIYYSAFRRKLLASQSHFICVSEHIRNLAIQMGARPQNTSVIGTGVDTSLIQFSDVPEAPVVLHVARLVEKKGTEYLIRAFGGVVKQIPEAKLRIVGAGPLENSLRALVARLRLESSVFFLGAQSHPVVLQELAAARLLCLPSVTAKSGDQEGLGQVLLEAGATGRPVVATEHGGIVDAIADGETGILVAERDSKTLSEALITLLTDTALASSLGRNARARVVRDFDARRQAEKVEEVYRRALG
ncbi:glycosyltransferase [Arthrobacter sp. UYCu723]